MAARANYVKIGTFVMLGVGGLLLLVFFFGAIRLRHETVSYFTYFNEAVTGLEVGAPVKIRGVKIGQVGAIRLAPDHRMVEVRSDLDVSVLRQMKVVPRFGKVTHFDLPSDVRAQLAGQGVTGTKLVTIDYFDPKTNPPPQLGFPTPPNYIPAARSLEKSLEDSIRTAMDGLANLVDTLSREGLSERILLATNNVNQMLDQVNGILRDVEHEGLPKGAAMTFNEFRVAVVKVQKLLDRLQAQDGLLASTQHLVNSFSDVGRNAADATQDLDATMAEIRRAAGAIRLLADELERDPDMLVKGRARGRTP
jgi:ABC-type transporter Mla subunit MlaD